MSIIVISFYLVIYLVFLVTNHPVYLALLVVISSIVSSLFLGMKISSWFFYSLMLVFLGGMMVMFLYFISLMNNSNTSIIKIPIITCMYLVVFLLILFNLSISSHNNPSLGLKFNFYFVSQGIFLVLGSFFLIVGLVLVVKNSEIFKGSLEMSQNSTY